MTFTDEQIEEMLRAYSLDYPPSWEGLRTVAEHAAQLEREACADLMSRIFPSVEMQRIWENGFNAALNKAAERIRERGEETE